MIRLPKFMRNEIKFRSIVDDAIDKISLYDSIEDFKEKKALKREIRGLLRRARFVGGFLTFEGFSRWMCRERGVWII